MGRRYGDILRATELETGLDNYVKHISSVDDRQTKRLKGGEVGAARSMNTVYLHPFNTDYEATSFAPGTISDNSVDKLGAVFTAANRYKVALAEGDTSTKPEGFKPARVTYAVPKADGTRTYKQSKITKLYYIDYNKDNFSAPFGAIIGTEKESAAYALIKTAILALDPNKDYRQISFRSEQGPRA